MQYCSDWNIYFKMSHSQWKQLTSHSFLRFVQPEILTNIFGAFINDHPVFPSFVVRITEATSPGHCWPQMKGIGNILQAETFFIVTSSLFLAQCTVLNPTTTQTPKLHQMNIHECVTSAKKENILLAGRLDIQVL